ncbi:hypothetical protein AAFF_G00334710 [Aldrovandia affinis]|uniref:LIM zinc-binding domain-containing protein n=1 Tax=Aldrovandia affinis TaxID=143900 RepID=A0AAD7WPV5_9TELE|nr:hypothetical protein AAFF_G00334710 [Aldrovandia affinis]
MSYAYSKPYQPRSEVKSGSPSQAIEDSKKKSSLLRDNSWIRKDEDEDEPVDRDPNFGRAVLSRYRSNEYLDSKPAGKDSTDSPDTPASTKTTSTSVQSLSKRFGGSQDQLSKPSSPPSYDTATANRSSEFKPLVTEDTKTRVTTKTSIDGKSTETTVTTTSSSTRTPITKRPGKTETFTERVFSDVKSAGNKVKPSALPLKPSKANDATDPEVTSSKGALDSLSDDLITKPTYTVYSPSKRTSSVSSPKTTEVTTVTTTKSENDWPLDSLSDTLITRPTHTVYSTPKSPKTTEVTTVTTTKDSEKDWPLDSLSDTLITRPTNTVYSTPKSPKTTEVTTVTTTKDSEKDWPLDSLSDTLITRPTHTVYSTPKSPKTTEVTTVTTTKDSENDWPLDSLSDTLTTKSTRTAYSTPDRDYGKSYTVSSPSSTTTTTRTSTRTYSSDYSPSTKTSSYSISTEPSYSYSDGSLTRSSYSRQPSDSSYEYTSLSSPTAYTKTSYLENSSPSDSLSDTFKTKQSPTSYSTSDRLIFGKDVCTSCRKPMSTEPKMILDDMQIHCHASCFKCEVCNSPLGHLKAGDSMWIYHRTVHCERCFEMAREKWHR